MKKILLSLLLGSTLSIVAAQDFPIGTWNVDASQTIQRQTSTEKSRLNQMSAERRSSIQQKMADRTYVFDKDGSMKLIVGGARSFSGNWSLRRDRLTLNFDNGDSADYTISQDGEVWLLIYSSPKREGVIITNLVLTPNR